MPEDDRRRRRRRRIQAATTHYQSVSRTSAIFILTTAAVILALFPRVRSLSRVTLTDSTTTTSPPSPLPVIADTSITRKDGSISQELQVRIRSPTSDDTAGGTTARRHDRFPDERLTPRWRAPPLYVTATGRHVSSPNEYEDVSGAYYTNPGIYFGAKSIVDNRQTIMTHGQTLSIPEKKNLVPRFQQRSILNEISWRKIGLITLIKLGLVKLKTIGIIKILYILIFKIKFLLITFFFKFFSKLKFYKIFKFFMLPLFLLSLLSTIILSLIPSSLPMINSIVSPVSDRLDVPTEIINTVTLPPSVTEEVLYVPAGTYTYGPAIAPGSVDPIFELLNAVNGIRYDTSELIDPTLKLFQKELSSEKCIERIACKMATTGKASIIPLWINWVLHRVSKLVPQNQLLYYLKTYEEVTNEIHINSPNPENWETWCSERYNCSTNNEINNFI